MNRDLLNGLQKNTKNIRNFCILAHVDHGKTTLADTLLASNGIISSRMSGKLRYMDSRPDEQERGITMKSSAISLIHKKNAEKYLINLIDSPGHVDFSSEVSTAIRLCDGATLLIDVCEGICPQTHAVLRQASQENLKLVLILNKIDRLISELQMTPIQAYYHLVSILEQFNALVAQQFSSLMTEKNNRLDDLDTEGQVEWADEDESKIYFSPKYKNVFFASAIDGWGFSIENFAEIYATKLGFKKDILLQTLWGDYFMDTKTKRIMKDAQSKAKKPLFVKFILDNIWQVYESVYTRRDTIMTEKIIKSLSIKMLPRDLKYSDPKGPLQALFSNWLPLGKNLLDMLIDILPSPLDMSSDKVEHLICPKLEKFKSLPQKTQDLKKDFMHCQSNDEKPVIVFISKMFAVEKDSINKKSSLTLEEISIRREAIRLKKLEITQKEISSVTLETNKKVTFNDPISKIDYISPIEDIEEQKIEDKHEFLAFARVFSGTLKKGQTVFILSPKHKPEDFNQKETRIDLNSSIEEIQEISKHCTKFEVNDIYLMMGRELELINEVPCGNIVAIGGLETLVHKSATLTTNLFCPSFTGMFMQTSPIVRVAIEPKNPTKMKDLIRGLRLLNQSDPCVEIMVQENGEHILCTAGEVHLQRCLDDLVKCFAMCEVNVSKPIIPFKETIVLPPQFDNVNEKIINESVRKNENGEGSIELESTDKKVTVRAKAKPLPIECTYFLEENVYKIKLLMKLNQTKICADKETLKVLVDFKNELQLMFENDGNGKDYFNVDQILYFQSTNILFNLIGNNENNFNNVWTVLNNLIIKDKLELSPKRSTENTNSFKLKEFETSVIHGFNLITSKGPICEEPMQGVAFFIEKFQLNDTQTESEQSFAGYSSQFTSLIKDCLRKSFEQHHQRLMAAMFKCEIMTVSCEALGKLYAVLGKRNAKITDETMKEGTSMFIVNAFIPVSESFGLAEEIRKRTSGLASPHIEFSHFEVIDIDPYWEPKTEEELLLLGDKADTENQAKKYMHEVRKRKGLFVKEKLVQDAEKQRTLAFK